MTLKGRVEGPDGQTVTQAFLLTTLRIEPSSPYWRGNTRFLSATAGLSCTDSRLKRPRVSVSSTPTTSGERQSISPASRRART